MSAWSAIRSAVASSTDAAGGFLVANLLWVLAAATGMLAGSAAAPGYALLLLVVPVTCGLLRMATHAARKDYPRLRHFRAGVRHRPWRHLALGGVEVVVVVMALVNVGVGMSGESLVSALVTVVAVYVGFSAVALGVVASPLLLDPRREQRSVVAILRLAVAVALHRPVSIGVITLLVMLLLLGVSQILLLGLLLPSFGALVAAHFVLPVADRLEGGVRSRLRRSARHHG